MWEIIGNASNLLGLLTVLFAGYSAVRLYQQNRMLRRLPKIEAYTVEELVRSSEGIHSTRPVALLISLLATTNSIQPQVERFLEQRGWSMPIVELHMDGIRGPQGRVELLRHLQQKRLELELGGFSEVHLFYAGPVTAAIVVGAMYDNWLPVKLYQRAEQSQPGFYEYWMPLTKLVSLTEVPEPTAPQTRSADGRDPIEPVESL